MSDYTDDYVDRIFDGYWSLEPATRKPKPTFSKGTFQKFDPKFKARDRVRLRNGTAEIEVTEVIFDYCQNKWVLNGKYVNSDNVIYQRNQDDFVPYDGESKMTNTNKLYTWKDTLNNLDLYGHYLATNSQGEWVMEVKGSGRIMAVAKDRVQEVLPYTLGVRFNNNGTTYHYLAEKDKFAEGFYLVKDSSSSGWQIARVVAVDTKSSKATVEFAPIGKLAVDLY